MYPHIAFILASYYPFSSFLWKIVQDSSWLAAWVYMENLIIAFVKVAKACAKVNLELEMAGGTAGWLPVAWPEVW